MNTVSVTHHDFRASALVTNYNTWEPTLKCVTALRQLSGGSLNRVLIVDDASTSPGPDVLEAEVMRLPQNVGYVQCVNLGFEAVMDEIVILFDSDAWPLTDVVGPVLQEFSEDCNLGAVGFRLVDEAGSPTGFGSPEPTVRELVLGQRLGASLPGAHNFDGRSGVLFSCALAIRKTAFL